MPHSLGLCDIVDKIPLGAIKKNKCIDETKETNDWEWAAIEHKE